VPGGGFDIFLLERRSGYLAFRVSGKDSKKAFEKESGGHRWQRIPPTEKRGRVQTSTVTVAVLDEDKKTSISIDPKDLVWKTCRGEGPGGQHRNKRETSVQVQHIPTGLTAKSEDTKSQFQNKELALSRLELLMMSSRDEKKKRARNNKRRKQVGSGMRGDKIRTVQVRRNIVTDHRTGMKMNLRKYLSGEIEDIL